MLPYHEYRRTRPVSVPFGFVLAGFAAVAGGGKEEKQQQQPQQQDQELPDFKDQARPARRRAAHQHQRRSSPAAANNRGNRGSGNRDSTTLSSMSTINFGESTTTIPINAQVRRAPGNLVEADLVDPPVHAVAVRNLRKRQIAGTAASILLLVAVILGVVFGVVWRDDDENGDSQSNSDPRQDPSATEMLWLQMGPTLVGSKPKEFFGESVALTGDGSIRAAGATGGGMANNAGEVRVYSFAVAGRSRKRPPVGKFIGRFSGRAHARRRCQLRSKN